VPVDLIWIFMLSDLARFLFYFFHHQIIILSVMLALVHFSDIKTTWYEESVLYFLFLLKNHWGNFL